MKDKIGTSINRVDAKCKIDGSAKYVADMKFKDMLFAKTLRSSKVRANIKDIKIPKLPDGYFVVDKNDIPGRNVVKMIFDDQPFFADGEVRYLGQPILFVVGPDKAKILEILDQIEVVYEEIEPIFTLEEAKSSDKPEICDNNKFIEYKFSKGEPSKNFDEAAKIIEGEYKTGYQEHIYIEPQGVIGTYENGKVTVYGSMQCPYYIKNALVQAFGWDEDRIRVVQATTGGAFGGKEEYPSVIAGHVAFAAVKAGKPVQLIFDRTEDIEVTPKRHPAVMKYRTALDENNKILAMDIEIILDGGAYSGLSNIVLQRAMFASTGVYRVKNLRVFGKVLATNTVPTGAFRGFGSPQTFYAMEMHMIHIAQELGLDPLDFKVQNLLKQGELSNTGGLMRDAILMPEMIESAVKNSDYRNKFTKYSQDTENYKGVGISLFFHGCGFTGSGENEIIKAKVKLRKKADETVEILIANVEMGQGLQTVARKIASKILQIPIEQVIFENPDTDRVPDSGPTVASRTTMIVGKLIADAALELKNRWDEESDFVVEKNYEQPPRINWDQDKFEGDAYPAYSWGVNVVEVEVDKITFEIKIVGVWSVFDVGTAIDERALQGQIDGGMAQGLGYGSIEVMRTKNGRIMQNSITDYMIPTSKDLPSMQSEIFDNPYEYGPFGAKGAGELTFVGAAPALAAAVQNALNLKISEIPVTPEFLQQSCAKKVT